MLTRLIKPVATLSALVAFACSSGSAQTLTEKFVTDTALPLVENKVAQGLSIGYVQGESWGIVHLGTANPSGTKADNLSLYELGSISKVFTGILLADSVVRGEIELDSKAEVNNAAGIRFPSRDGRSITWRDLSTHRSGLPRLPANLDIKSPQDPYRGYDASKAAKALADLELARTPGESQEYSNFAVSVLGYLIAERAGKTYQQLLSERIAQPLGMSDCSVGLTDDQKKRFATPHEAVGSPTLVWDFSDLPGAGGVHASMRDMMRFAKAQLDPPAGELGKAIELAWQQHSEPDASGPATGLGWMIAGDGETRWHNGGTGGSRTALYVNRRIKTAVVILCNTSVNNEIDELATYLIQVAAGLPNVKKPVFDKSDAKGRGQEAPKVSPFTSVGLNDDKVFVQYEGRLLQWHEIDGIKVFDIIAAAKKQYGNRWGKRIREDLVEVLWGMGHQPGETVKLRMQDVKTNEEVVVEKAKMTSKNRQAIRAESRALAGNPVVGDFDEPVVVDAKHRARLVGRYQLAPNFIFDVKDRDGRMMVGITNQPTQEVFPDSPTHWSYRSVKATLEFKLDDRGPAKSLVLHQNGLQQTAKRIK